MNKNKWIVGMKVHVNKDDYQWGRIAEDGIVQEVRNKTLLVLLYGIRASVIVNKTDAQPR
jgi:hypothetical protein